MSHQVLSVARLYDGQQEYHNVTVEIAQQQIHTIRPHRADDPPIQTGLLVPGFVDIQVNGGGGVLFNAAPSVATLTTMLQAHAQFGTTAMLPTVITDTLNVMQQAAEAVAQIRQQRPHQILGIHFEGPHISQAKKGAHCSGFIRPLGDAEWSVLARTDLGVKLITVAPEMVSPAEIQRLIELGCVVFLGHSNATYEQTQAALAAGAHGFTHLFNAMSANTARAPGMVTAALLDPASFCGLIVDGHHVAYPSCQLALRCKGTSRIALVTDAMPPVGTKETHFTLVDRQVTRYGDKLVAHSGELAGSVLDMASALRLCIHRLQVPWQEALLMATQVPLQALQLTPPSPLLQAGVAANFVLLDADFYVRQCWLAGQAMMQQ